MQAVLKVRANQYHSVKVTKRETQVNTDFLSVPTFFLLGDLRQINTRTEDFSGPFISLYTTKSINERKKDSEDLQKIWRNFQQNYI